MSSKILNQEAKTIHDSSIEFLTATSVLPPPQKKIKCMSNKPNQRELPNVSKLPPPPPKK